MPAQQKVGTEWYRGTADAIRQNLDLVRGKGFEHVLILSGDHVYKMNYLQMLDYHKKQNADLTVSAIRVRKEQAASNLGVLLVDQESRIIGFEEKPAQPKTIPNAPEYAFASMGIYMFKADAMREALKAEGDDFGKDIVPSMIDKSRNICAYDFGEMNKIQDYVVEVEDGKRRRVLVDRTRDSTYWRDVGSIDSYYEASMELVGVDPLFNLYGEKWVFRTYERPLPPTKCVLGGRILDSLVSGGCIISGGLVQRSLLSPAVVVERGAIVEDSVIFDDVIIEPNAKIRRAIIDKESRIHMGASIGYDPESDKRRGCAISNNGIVVVPRGIDVGST